MKLHILCVTTPSYSRQAIFQPLQNLYKKREEIARWWATLVLVLLCGLFSVISVRLSVCHRTSNQTLLKGPLSSLAGWFQATQHTPTAQRPPSSIQCGAEKNRLMCFFFTFDCIIIIIILDHNNIPYLVRYYLLFICTVPRLRLYWCLVPRIRPAVPSQRTAVLYSSKFPAPLFFLFQDIFYPHLRVRPAINALLTLE